MLFQVQQGQYFGFEQVRRHGVDGFEHDGTFSDQSIPVDVDVLDGKDRFIGQLWLKQPGGLWVMILRA